MINNIEGQSKSELIKIVTEQQSHDTQREYYIMSLQAETDELRTQLAKANERVERYKSAIDEECILWDFTVDEKNPKKSIQLLLDITDAVARDTDVNSKARKFAIENQIKGAADYTAYCQYAPTDSNRKEWAKQLRKEQECEQ